MRYSPKIDPFIVEEVYMPVYWINYRIQAILWVLAIFTLPKLVLVAFNRIDSECL